MPAHKSLLLRVEVRKAGKLCHCKHDKKHTMKKGELRVVVKEPGALSGPGYCGDCARKMLDLAEERIAELRAALG